MKSRDCSQQNLLPYWCSWFDDSIPAWHWTVAVYVWTVNGSMKVRLVIILAIVRLRLSEHQSFSFHLVWLDAVTQFCCFDALWLIWYYTDDSQLWVWRLSVMKCQQEGETPVFTFQPRDIVSQHILPKPVFRLRQNNVTEFQMAQCCLT